jgi:hypothetical protein
MFDIWPNDNRTFLQTSDTTFFMTIRENNQKAIVSSGTIEKFVGNQKNWKPVCIETLHGYLHGRTALSIRLVTRSNGHQHDYKWTSETDSAGFYSVTKKDILQFDGTIPIRLQTSESNCILGKTNGIVVTGISLLY